VYERSNSASDEGLAFPLEAAVEQQDQSRDVADEEDVVAAGGAGLLADVEMGARALSGSGGARAAPGGASAGGGAASMQQDAK
jgi:hypothetical protein